MEIYEQLEELYNEYDSTNIRSKKIEILNKIIELDPTDIDSMHRLISFLPKDKQLEALLKLKEDAKKIVAKLNVVNDDLYSNYQTRPYVIVLYDILTRYEAINKIEKAYELMQEISAINEGDNLGIRFHIVAYYFGTGKLDELKTYVANNIDTYSVALRFGKLYLDEIKKNKKNDFLSLYNEFPYLYSFLTKEIKISRGVLDTITNSIECYKPLGFYDQLLFYKLLQIYMLPDIKKSLSKLVSRNRYIIKNKIQNKLPKITKHVLYALGKLYDDNYESFVRFLSEYDIQENEFLEVKDKLYEYQIINVEEFNGKKKVSYNEASFMLLKFFIDNDQNEIDYLDNVYHYYMNYLRNKKY